MPAVRRLDRSNLLFRDNRLNGGDVRNLMAYGLRVVTVRVLQAFAQTAQNTGVRLHHGPR